MFSAVREIIAAFAGPDEHLGLYGAFGYDLAFQFEPVRLREQRDDSCRDLVLHIPDRLYAVDRKRETATVFSYDFDTETATTSGMPRDETGRAGAGEVARVELGDGIVEIVDVECDDGRDAPLVGRRSRRWRAPRGGDASGPSIAVRQAVPHEDEALPADRHDGRFQVSCSTGSATARMSTM